MAVVMNQITKTHPPEIILGTSPIQGGSEFPSVGLKNAFNACCLAAAAADKHLVKMARNRDGSVPFMLAEDLHLWLISFTLLMTLTSSLAFVSSQFHAPPDKPWIEFVILMNWAIVFGASVLLWGLALLLNTRVAAWRLLFATMCMVVIPRSCLPFRVGDCMLQYICFIGFNFFTSSPTRKISFLCDIAWGALPLFLVASKSIAGLTAIAAGHVGYQIIQAFSKQLREAKRLVLPLFSCSPTAFDGDSRKRASGLLGHSSKRGAQGFLQKFPLRRGLSHTAASGFNDLQVASSRALWLNKTAAVGVYSDTDHDTGIWRKENESQWFVVPSGHYGYVDARWYLDLKFLRPDQWSFSSPNAFASFGRTKGFKLGIPATAAVPEAAEESVSNDTPTACLRVDTPEVGRRRFSRFHRSVSVGQGPEKHEASGSSEAAPATSESIFADQRRSDAEGAASRQPSPTSAGPRENGSLIDRESVGEERRERKNDGLLRRSKAMPLLLQKVFCPDSPFDVEGKLFGRNRFFKNKHGELGS
ncbi:hypothetical protein Emag_002455 [Eimeria magna]